MQTSEIRKKFLSYFEKRGHILVASSPVIPHEDPTLLFTNAGMNQFKDVFLGQGQRSYTRAATAQKCIRAGGKHNDLENVGHTSRHLTFLEMLGNFSFGDYFKKEAIAFAWEVSTEVFGFDSERIWPTVFREDDEAFEIWKNYVPEKRITRMDEADNFWSMGDSGPCGPCSELYYDRGERFGPGTNPANDPGNERYLEFWNLVFMQYNRFSDGRLEKLAKQSIDTGSGLERVMSLKMGVDTIFETDIFMYLIHKLSDLCNIPYNPQDARAASFRVISDHLRTLCFAIADGAQPSNVERGYVLRKILRRAVRYGKTLGFEEPFMAKLLPSLIECMGEDYPELKKHQDRIGEILTVEEESFGKTLKRGGKLLVDICSKAKMEKRAINGEEAFSLKDTYGMPLDEIKLIAHDEGIAIDEKRFQELEVAARELSRSGQKKTEQLANGQSYDQLAHTYPSRFVGYTTLSTETRLQSILVDHSPCDELKEGEEGLFLIESTPFYSEKGGQVSDLGHMLSKEGVAEVLAVSSPAPGLILHQVRVTKGSFKVDSTLFANVDRARRLAVERSHTATHLLHWALAQVLGDHIQQKGSLVDVDVLRFDFSHHKPVTSEQLAAIERLCNEKILDDLEVKSYERTFLEVQADPTIKQFFADKYGDLVRIVDIGFSKELCGGTHVRHTSQIGHFCLSHESSVASGIRRIEAQVGYGAIQERQNQQLLISQLCQEFKTSPKMLVERLQAIVLEGQEFKKHLNDLKKEAMRDRAERLCNQAATLGSFRYLEVLTGVEIADLPLLAEQLSHFEGICVLVAKEADRVQMIVRIGKETQKAGLQANTLIQSIAHCIDGRGGGKPDMAQAGGKKVEGLEAMLTELRLKITSYSQR